MHVDRLAQESTDERGSKHMSNHVEDLVSAVALDSSEELQRALNERDKMQQSLEHSNKRIEDLTGVLSSCQRSLRGKQQAAEADKITIKQLRGDKNELSQNLIEMQLKCDRTHADYLGCKNLIQDLTQSLTRAQEVSDLARGEASNCSHSYSDQTSSLNGHNDLIICKQQLEDARAHILRAEAESIEVLHIRLNMCTCTCNYA